MTRTYRERIAGAAAKKNSPIIAAIDPDSDKDNPAGFSTALVRAIEESICAIKLNFHVILPLSASELSELNSLAHSFGLQSIADIKLNDIGNTNSVALSQLSKMGFDAVIANPFIGASEFATLAENAHRLSLGLIGLAYMSHPGAAEGYGLQVISRGKRKPLYRIFFERAVAAGADGVVIGANRAEIMSELKKQKGHQLLPIYSPGVGVQGGDIQKAIRAGTTYPIVGRAILGAKDPRLATRQLLQRVNRIKNDS